MPADFDVTSDFAIYLCSQKYVYIIDQARGQDGWILAEFSFCFFMDRDEVEVHKNAKRERGQYPAILTELAWSIKDLLYGIKSTEKNDLCICLFHSSHRIPGISNRNIWSNGKRPRFSLQENHVVASQWTYLEISDSVFEQTVQSNFLSKIHAICSLFHQFKGKIGVIWAIFLDEWSHQTERHDASWQARCVKISHKLYILVIILKLGQWLAKSKISHCSKFDVNAKYNFLLYWV